MENKEKIIPDAVLSWGYTVVKHYLIIFIQSGRCHQIFCLKFNLIAVIETENTKTALIRLTVFHSPWPGANNVSAPRVTV